MPRLLQEMVASIVSAEPRFQIVGRLGAESDLLSAIHQIGPEVVITQETKELGSLEPHHNTRAQFLVNVLAINETGRETSLYRLILCRTPLGEASAKDLISAIDRVAGNS